MPQSSVARRHCQGEVPTSPTAVLTVGNSERLVLSSISFHNSSGAIRNITMWIVPVGESQTASNMFAETELLNKGSYRESGIGQVLEAGDKIYLDADGGSVSYHICGASLTDV